MFIYLRTEDFTGTKTHAIDIHKATTLQEIYGKIAAHMGYDTKIDKLWRISATKGVDPPGREICIETNIPDSPYHNNPHPFSYIIDDKLKIVTDTREVRSTHTYKVEFLYDDTSTVDLSTDGETTEEEQSRGAL